MKFERSFIFGSFFLIVIILASTLIVHIEQTQTSTPQPTALASTPTASPSTPFDGYGLYDSCSLRVLATCLSNLDNMAAAGFKLVINYGELRGTVNAQEAYLDYAQSLGMKVIVALNNPDLYKGVDLHSDYPDLMQACNCNNNHDFIEYVVNLVKNHPAVWGYYIGDEVNPSDHDKMKSALADVVHQLDPKHPRLFIDNPPHAIATWRGNSPFFDTADVIGSDFYPVRDNSPDYPPIDEAGSIAAGVQEYADTYKEDSAIALQAFSYGQYHIPGTPYPTASQMESMLSQTLANAHPRIILWYSYDDTMAYSNAAQHWNDLKSTIARHMIKSTYQTQQ